MCDKYALFFLITLIFSTITNISISSRSTYYYWIQSFLGNCSVSELLLLRWLLDIWGSDRDLMRFLDAYAVLNLQAYVVISLVHLTVPNCLAFEAADFLLISLQDEAWWGSLVGCFCCTFGLFAFLQSLWTWRDYFWLFLRLIASKA